MKYQIIAALIATTAAICKPGLTISYYDDAECTIIGEILGRHRKVYDENEINQRFNKCQEINPFACMDDGTCESKLIECSSKGVMFTRYHHDSDCEELDQQSFKAYGVCYKAGGEDYPFWVKWTDAK